MRDYLPNVFKLSSSEPMTRKLYVLILVAVLLGLSGCANTPNQTQEPSTNSQVDSQASQQLLLIRQQLDDGEFDNAFVLLQQLRHSSLQENEKAEWLLLATKLAIVKEDTRAATSYLNNFSHLTYKSADQELEASLLSAKLAEIERRFWDAVKIRDSLLGLLADKENNKNKEALWNDLLQMDVSQLSEQVSSASSAQLKGWLELAIISRSYHLTLDEQIEQVRRWTLLNPTHPASLQLPGALAGLESLAESRPKRVSLLLPLSGRLQQSGQAIRDGFIAAYYESLKKGYQVPEVQLLDHNKIDNLDSAYAQAQANNSQWLVGPLNKSDVQNLQQRDLLPIPTLALNYGERSKTEAQIPPVNLFQFGLAAEDEARQIAEQAWQDGHQRALVLVPQGAWGERVFTAFREHWLELGGDIEEVRFYPNLNDYNPEISALLNVDDSQKRHRTMERLVRLDIDFEPRRRQDADWLFMLGLPSQARLIKPALAFNFASELPVYATSHVFSGSINKQKDRDLNGIHFCDAPWLLRESELKTEINSSLEKGQGNYSRLYAMGVDAFRLLTRVKQLQAFPESQVFGATGRLSLDFERRIIRQTECTQFHGGTPTLLVMDE